MKYLVHYSQDSSSVVVGGSRGYRIYSLKNLEQIELVYINQRGPVKLVDKLFDTNLVASVSVAAPMQLKLCHVQKRAEICTYTYRREILAVRLHRQRAIVSLEGSLYIHDISDMRVLRVIDVPSNPEGLFALSYDKNSCKLAYPTVGQVLIFDALKLVHDLKIVAHESSPLAAVVFDRTASKIATASKKGTVIKVFSTSDGQKLFEFRRGLTRCVDIASLRFSACDKFLCCGSNTETVHVFKLQVGETPAASWMGYFASYLPDALNRERAFATAYLPSGGVKKLAGIVTAEEQLKLVVTTDDGYIYVYNIDSKLGGDLDLYKKHYLGDSELDQRMNVVLFCNTLFN